MQALDIPWYSDPDIWTVILAAVAIFLSQAPPIHVMLRRARLSLELYSKIHLTHKVGNPNLQIHLLLGNVGGRSVRIREIKVVLSRDGKHLVDLPAHSFLQSQTDKDSVLFTTFSIAPDEEWAHITNFLNEFGRDDGNQYFKLERAMRDSFREKRAELEQAGLYDENKDLVEHSADLTDAAYEFHDKHFCWFPGVYTLDVKVYTEQKTADISRQYRFTIFESQSANLQEIRDFYRFGGGFWWNPPDVLQGINVDISED